MRVAASLSLRTFAQKRQSQQPQQLQQLYTSIGLIRTHGRPHRRIPSSICHGVSVPCFSTDPSPPPTSTIFFSYTSVRAQRRRRRQRAHRLSRSDETVNVSETDEEPLEPQRSSRHDDRTVMDILFPNPYKGEEDPDKTVWPKTYNGWKTAVTLTWQEYRSSWDGFWTSKGLLVEDPSPTDQASDLPSILDDKQKKVLGDKQKKVKQNIRHNTVFLVKEAEKLKNEIQTRTGIYNKEDLRIWAADMMRLGSDCVQQFMSGYRKGRDEEVEKMLTQYFQELEVAANQPKRRRRKRRVMNRFVLRATDT